MKKCAKCGTQLLKDARFCMECGAEANVQNLVVCSECGKSVEPEDVYCAHCGATLASSAIQESAPSQEKPKSHKVQKPKSGSTTTSKLKKKSGSDKGSGRNWLKIAVAAAAVFILYQLIPWSSFNDDGDWTGGGYTEETSTANDLTGVYSDPALEQAKQEYLEAYDRYTKLATQGGEGDIEAAKEDYQRKFERYKKIAAGDRTSISSSASNSANATADSPASNNNLITVPKVDDIANSSDQVIIQPELLPEEVIEHEMGAIVRLPKRLKVATGKVELLTRKPNERERTMGVFDDILIFNNYDFYKIFGLSQFIIPAGINGQTLMIKCTPGWWVPMEISPKTDERGKRVFEVALDSETTPLEFAVIPTRVHLDELSNDLKDLVLFERSVILDKKNVKSRDTKNLSFKEKSVNKMSFGHLFFQENVSSVPFQIIELYKDLRVLSLKDYGNDLDNWNRYRVALMKLNELRLKDKGILDKEAMHTRLFEILYKKDGRKERKVESLMWFWPQWENPSSWVDHFGGLFAPWGIEFTNSLVLTLDKKLGVKNHFDLGVLSTVGQVGFTDIDISKDDLPKFILNNYHEASSKIYADSKYAPSQFLRLWSSRSVNESYLHFLASLTNDYALRWGPVIYGAVRIVCVSGPFAAAAFTPAAIPFWISLGWAAYEYYLDNYPALDYEQRDFITQIEYLTSAEGAAWDLVGNEIENRLIASFKNASRDMYFSKVKIAGLSVKSTKSLTGIVKKIDPHIIGVQALLSAVTAIYLDYVNDSELKTLKKLTQGKLGYENLNIPPVMLIVTTHGLEAVEEFEYPVVLDRTIKYTLNVNNIYRSNLKGNLGKKEMYGLNGLPSEWTESTLKKISSNAIRQKPAANMQMIRFGISKSTIEQQLVDLNIDQGWEKIGLTDLELVARLNRGNWQKYFNLEEVTRETEKNKDFRYSIIHLYTEDIIGAHPGFPSGFESSQLRNNFTRPLKTQYSIELGYIQNNNFIPVTNPQKVDFFNAPNLDLNDPNNFNAWINTTKVPAEKLVTYAVPIKWHLIDAGILEKKENEKQVALSGLTVEKSNNPFIEPIPKSGVTVTCTYSFKGKKYSKDVVSDKTGMYLLYVPCKATEVMLHALNERILVDLGDCSKSNRIDIGTGIKNIIQTETSDPEGLPIPPLKIKN